MRFTGGLAGFLAVLNNARNAFGLAERGYVPGSLALTAGILAAGRRAGLDAPTMGLARAGVRPGLRWGLGVTAVVAAGLSAALAAPGLRPLLVDDRVSGLTATELAGVVLLRIPFGTVLLEEVAFRGVLLGAWARHRSTAEAVVGSSTVFALWHVVPTLDLVRQNDLASGALATTAAVVGGCAVTGVAGVGFAWLRLRGGGVVAPALAHLATNGLGAVASWVAAGPGREWGT